MKSITCIAVLALAASSISARAIDVRDDPGTAIPDSPEQTAAKLVKRLEALEKVEVKGKTTRRVYRRDDGTIRFLRFHEMELTDHEFHAVSTIRDVASIDFSRTNLSDRHLAYFRQLPKLVNIRTHLTKITDAGIKHLINYPSLRSVCMGNVAVSYEAWANMNSLHQAKHKTKRQIAGGPPRPRKK